MRVPRPILPFAAVLAGILLFVSGPSRSDTSGPKPIRAKEPIRWRTIVSGNAEAKKNSKPALYFFTAAWCGPCRLLQEQVFSVPEIAGQIEKDFVPIEVGDRMRETGANSPEMLALADRYRLRGFPTLVVSRPGLATNLTLEGWAGRGAAIEFLKTAKKRFLDLEKKPH